MWNRKLGPIVFSVEHRNRGNDGGPALRLCESGGKGRELVRFDCLLRDPHLHLDPNGRDEVVRLDPLADPVSCALEQVTSDLTGLLERADFDAQPSTGWRAGELDDLLSQAEDAMRNPPTRLDELELELLRTRLGEKWLTHDRDVLPAGVAEMDFPLAEPIRLGLQRAVDRCDVGYPIAPKNTGLREVFAERMQALYGWQVDPGRVEIITDVVQGLYVALEALSRKGEGAVVQTPIYPPFLAAVAETQRRLVENRLTRTEGGFEIDFDALRDALDQHTRVILLCNPHNPSGRVFTRSELEEIAEIADRNQLIVVSDEIHQDLVYDGRRHVPFASLSPEAAARTITLHSATKAFNIAGLRCAVAHFGSAELHKRFTAAALPHIRGGIGLLGIYATLAAWRHSQPWLDDVRRYLGSNRDFLRRTLAEKIPQIVFHPPQATYLAWLDCGALELPSTPGAYFLSHARVALSDGYYFGGPGQHFARLNFATSREILTRVLDHMATALPDFES